uniref:SHSP domain-containing protein n=1 Tax=Arundo donax TaxID=35708 RepID=A0A0A9ET02_ARUDO
MAAGAAAAARRYMDFVPPHSRLEEPDKVALRVDLSAEGFKKEQLRVQIDNFGRLRISGERPLGAEGNRWRRFRKDFQVPEGCNAGAISARFDKDGILLITMPRLSTAPAEEPTADTGGVAGQDRKVQASAPQAAAAAAEAEEKEGGKEDDTGATSMERPGQDEHDTSNNAMAASAARPAAYGFAKDRRRMVWAIFAVVLALVGAGLYARYRLMDPSAETAPPSTDIIGLSDS